MEKQTKNWWVGRVIIYKDIAEWTYGPGYYTGTEFLALFEEEETVLEKIYQTTLLCYAVTGDCDPNYKPMLTEAREDFLCQLKYNGYRIEYRGTVPRIVFGGYRYQETVCIDIRCLENSGTRNFTKERVLLTQLLQKLTSSK